MKETTKYLPWSGRCMSKIESSFGRSNTSGMDASVHHSNSSCLRVAAIPYPPHTILLSQGPNSKVGGTLVSVLDIIAGYLGLCYKFVIPSDLRFGDISPNGTLTGLLAAVVNGEADMTSLVTLTEGRNKYLDFSSPLYMEQILVVVKRPVLEPDIAGFVKPLSLSVWLMLVAVIVLTALAYTLMLALWRTPALATPRDVQDCVYDGRASVEGSLPPLLWSLAVLLSQSTKWEHSAASLRVVASVWFMASLILSTVYEANLKAMLIKPRIQVPFDNLEQLDQSQYPLYLLETTAAYTAVVVSMGTTSADGPESVITHMCVCVCVCVCAPTDILSGNQRSTKA